MIGQDAHDVKRKVISILRILNDTAYPIGSRIISSELKSHGVDLTERAVRYHLKLLDKGGLTHLSGRDGRTITVRGKEELKSGLVIDKIGFVINRIELLAFRTTFSPRHKSGEIAVNLSFFPHHVFDAALVAMEPVFKAGLCMSDLVAVAREGERLGQTIVPHGMVGFATICSITINGVLLKAGIPMDSRFGGILEMRQSRPGRFVELIQYEGSTLDPSEVFISGRMTSVTKVAVSGDGKVLANFREIPAQSHELVQSMANQLEQSGIRGIMTIGEPNEAVGDIPVGVNRIGVILIGGLNPVAAVVEAGIPVENTAMAGVMEYNRLADFWDLRKPRGRHWVPA